MRDAFGLRPLYYARKGRRFGFASDARVLRDLGLASADLDDAAIAAYLARFGVHRGRTGFSDIRCVPPGSWVQVDGEGRWKEGRWFHPERLLGEPLSGEEAVQAYARARSWRRSGRGRSVARSGCRCRRVGTRASSPLRLPSRESRRPASRNLSIAICPSMRRSPLERSPRRSGIAGFPRSSPPARRRTICGDFPRRLGGPLGWFAFPQAIAPAETAARAGVDVLFTGQGGEPLFSPPAVAVLDLFAGRISARLRRGGAQLRPRVDLPLRDDRQGDGSRRGCPDRLIAARERMRTCAAVVGGQGRGAVLR